MFFTNPIFSFFVIFCLGFLGFNFTYTPMKEQRKTLVSTWSPPTTFPPSFWCPSIMSLVSFGVPLVFSHHYSMSRHHSHHPPIALHHPLTIPPSSLRWPNKNPTLLGLGPQGPNIQPTMSLALPNLTIVC